MAAAVPAARLPCYQSPARARAPRLRVPPSGNRLVPLHPCRQIAEVLVSGHLLIVGDFTSVDGIVLWERAFKL